MIKKINLTNFKKHINFEQTINSNVINIYGNNALGKTSILEAISLFSPGKNPFNNEIENSINLNKDFFSIKIKTNHELALHYKNKKKEIIINQQKRNTLSSLEYIKIFTITPFLSLAFWKDNSIKRKFIDKLILQNDSSYANFFLNYTKAIKKKNELIQKNEWNNHWEYLNTLIKENGIEITKIRNKILNVFQNNFKDKIEYFPNFEEQMEIFHKPLSLFFEGPHKTKFNIIINNKSDKFASTAEQNTSLTNLIIAATKQIEEEKIFLLDDISCLDQTNIKKKLKTLQDNNIQTWITGTNKLNIDSVQNVKLKSTT